MSRPNEPVLNAWLAPDGTLYKCPPYGHVFRATELYEDRAEVRELADRLTREWDDTLRHPVDGIYTQALEELGYLKLATRYGRTDWYYGLSLTHITEKQADAILAWCASEGMPWPDCINRETRKLL